MRFNIFRGALQNPSCLLNSRNRYQLLATLIMNLMTFSHGLGIGWTSPVLRSLQTADSPFEFAVFVEEVSWIGSLLGIGSVVGNLFAGLLQNRFGRKPIMYAVALPHACFWLLAYFARSVEYLYVGRLLAGVAGGGGYIVFPIFISEIADVNIRGMLSSMVMLSVNTGVMIGYIISANVAYFTVPFIILVLPICYFVCILFLPETPCYLISRGKFTAAERSFRFYKNIKETDAEALSEFNDMKTKLFKEQSLIVNSYSLQDFVNRPALKAFSTAGVLVLANQFTGLFCFVTYAADIFAMSYSTVDIGICTVTTGLMQIAGNCITIYICDKYGRKVLMLASTLGVAISLAAFGCYTYLAPSHDVSNLGWLPLVLMVSCIFMGSMGLIALFFVVVVEFFPPKIRSIAVSSVVISLSSVIFVVLKLFPLCMVKWGISATMWGCSAVALASFLYLLCFLEETKGKSLVDA